MLEQTTCLLTQQSAETCAEKVGQLASNLKTI
jgi:hypothetical protein